MKNDFKKPKDYLILLRALSAWWLLCFSIILLVTSMIDMVSPLFHGGSHMNLWLFRTVFAALAAIPASLAVYFVIIPRVDKQFRIMRRIVARIAEEGYSEPVIKDMEEQLEYCMTTRSGSSSYRNQYAMFLTEAYISLHDYKKAEGCLNCVDYEFMKNELRRVNTIAVQRNILLIHVLRVQLAANSGDIKRTEECISKGERVFALFRDKSEIINYLIDTAYFESLMVHKQYENAMQLLDKYKDNEELSFGYILDNGRCLLRMGRTEEAQRFFDKAYSMATNDWRRRTVELERSFLPAAEPK